MRYFNSLLCLFIGIAAVSCAVPKNIPYFQDIESGNEYTVAEPKLISIKPNDMISIIVKSRDIQLTNLFNLPYMAQRLGTDNISGNYSTGVCGYSVDGEGCIDFPVLGKLHIAGMTRSEVEDYIKGQLIGQNLVNDPVVTVDYMNLHVSVLGEVARPGRFSIDHDQYSLLDAISAAGDLTIYGVREKVKVIRSEGNEKKTYIVNLCNADELMASPVYYLQQNDIVYVDPNTMRSRQSTINGNNLLSSSFWLSVASLLMTFSFYFIVK